MRGGRESSPLLATSAHSHRRGAWPLAAAMAGTLAVAAVLGVALVRRSGQALELVELRGSPVSYSVGRASSAGTLKKRRIAVMARPVKGDDMPEEVAAAGINKLAQFGMWAQEYQNETDTENIRDEEDEKMWWKQYMYSEAMSNNSLVRAVDYALCGEEDYQAHYREYKCDYKSFWALLGLGCQWGYTDPDHPWCRPRDEVFMEVLLGLLGLLTLLFLACFFCGCCHKLR